MLSSPYAPGSTPEYLAGRGGELEAIRSRLARMSALGRSGGPLQAFYGSRGLGKTSLLREAQRRAVRAGYLTVWVTGRDDLALAPELARWLAEELRRGSLAERSEALLQGLDKIQVEVGLPGAKIGLEGGADRRTDQRGSADSAVIEGCLRDAGRFAQSHDHHGLAVFVDEFQEARLADRRSLLIALQHFDGAPQGSPVAIIAAGLPSVLSAVPEAATFGERTDFHEVGLLTDVAVAEALILPARDVGVGWSEGAVEEAIGIARGYPHQVQLIGEETWRMARPEQGDQILVGHVREGAELTEQRMSTLFRSRLAKTTADQQRFLLAMAGLGETPVARRKLALQLEVSTEALSRPRQELIDRGLIEPAGRGLLRFTIPGFGAYLRLRAEEELGEPGGVD